MESDDEVVAEVVRYSTPGKSGKPYWSRRGSVHTRPGVVFFHWRGDAIGANIPLGRVNYRACRFQDESGIFVFRVGETKALDEDGLEQKVYRIVSLYQATKSFLKKSGREGEAPVEIQKRGKHDCASTNIDKA